MKVYQILITILFLLSILAFSAADAVNIKLTSLMCYEDSAEAGDDEIIIEIYINDIWISTLGPFDMRSSRQRIINHEIPNPDNYDVTIKLMEDDPKSDDEIGTFTISPKPTGVFSRHFPELAGEEATHYRVSYEVTDERTTTQKYYVKLVSVRCDDAQEAKDEIKIYINDYLWLGFDFKTGQTRYIHSDNLEVTSPVTISVWENDALGKDLIGEYTFDITRDLLRTTQSHTFSCDKGLTGDAKYTVSYFVAS